MVAFIMIVALFFVVGLAIYAITNNNTTSGGNAQRQVHEMRIADVQTLVEEIAKTRQEISRQKINLEIDRIRIRQGLSFAMLKQLHRESHLMGSSWHANLVSARNTRKTFWLSINSLKANRRYHAKNRDQSRGSKRTDHARFGQKITGSLDTLYALLSDLDREIALMSANLTSYNRQTAMLRDYIGTNCGEPGRKWRAGILGRAEQRKQLPPSKKG